MPQFAPSQTSNSKKSIPSLQDLEEIESKLNKVRKQKGWEEEDSFDDFSPYCDPKEQLKIRHHETERALRVRPILKKEESDHFNARFSLLGEN